LRTERKDTELPRDTKFTIEIEPTIRPMPTSEIPLPNLPKPRTETELATFRKSKTERLEEYLAVERMDIEDPNSTNVVTDMLSATFIHCLIDRDDPQLTESRTLDLYMLPTPMRPRRETFEPKRTALRIESVLPRPRKPKTDVAAENLTVLLTLTLPSAFPKTWMPAEEP
jgi:hypothetical protein